MSDSSCGNCLFAVTDPQDLSVVYCYRYPPTVQIVGIANGSVSKATTYPPVDRVNGWCGEFAARSVVVSLVNGE